MSDSLDSYITNWASKYSGYKPLPSDSTSTPKKNGDDSKPFQVASASATDPVPAKSDTSDPPAPDTPPPPPPSPPAPQPMPTTGPGSLPLPPIPVPSGRVDPRVPSSLPSRLQPQTGVPGGGAPLAPTIQQVAAQAQPPVQPVKAVDESGRNNPGNIRIPGTSRFQTFPTMQAGIDAIGNQIQVYQDRDGINTLAGIITKYSPPNENPTPLLIKRAAARTGLDPNQPLNLRDPATKQKVVNAILAQEGGGAPGVQDVKDEIGMPRQYLVAATERDPGERFRPDPSWNSDQPGMRPSSWDIPRIMSGPVPQLLALASVFARVPLTVALGAYGAMAKAQQNGQLLEYQMSKDRWQTALKEHQAMETMEGQDVDEALMEFKDDPDSMQQAMMGIARRYNDPRLNQMAQARRFDQIDQLQKLRDKYNQPLQKWQIEQQKAADEHQAAQDKHQKVLQEQKDQQTFDNAVAAKDAQFAKDNPDATQQQKDEAHIKNVGAVDQELHPAKESTGEEKEIQNVVGPDGKETGQQVREGKGGGLRTVDTDKPYTLKPGEKLVPQPKASTAGGKPEDYEWTAPDGTKQIGSVLNVPGRGLVNPATDEDIEVKPGTIPRKVGVTTQGAPEAYTGPESWPGMPNKPPPGANPAAWSQAVLWAQTGVQPSGLYRNSQMKAEVDKLLPVAQSALGITPTEEANQQIRFLARKTAEAASARYYAAGRGADQMRSLNTVADHLNLFRQYAAAVDNGDTVRANQLQNRLSLEMGGAEIADYNVAKTLVADEVVRLLTTTGGTRGDREDAQQLLSGNFSPGQFAGVANTLTNFVRGRFDALRQGYINNVPGRDEQAKAAADADFHSMLTPDAHELFGNAPAPIAGAATQAPAQTPAQTAPSTPQRPSSLPAGSQWSPSRKQWRDPSGKLYDDQGKPL